MLNRIILLTVVILNKMEMSSVSRMLGVIDNVMQVSVRIKSNQKKILTILTVADVIFMRILNHNLRV
ncbi:hypothetical protein AZ045_003807 [Enterobacter hormaechei]|nr:hypothetical protein AZ045_003807 [Enterobacter hormaechei]